MAQYKNIDIVPDETITRVHLSQGDIGRTLIFYLFENALSWSVPASSMVKCQGTKPSGFGFSVSCTYSGNAVTCVTTDEMTDEYGQIEAELVITSSDESQIFGTSNFILDIEKNPHLDGTVDGNAENPVIANLNAVIKQATYDWLDEHPEATTTVVDGSITEPKLASALATKINNKADTSALTNEATVRANADTALSNQIAALQGAVGSPLVASTVAGMTDTTKIYVYTGSETGYTSGNWYYYNGSAWVSGGVYNAVAVNTDTTLTQSGVAADAKATGDKIKYDTSYGITLSKIDERKLFSVAGGETIRVASADGSNMTPEYLRFYKADGTQTHYYSLSGWSTSQRIIVPSLDSVLVAITGGTAQKIVVEHVGILSGAELGDVKNESDYKSCVNQEFSVLDVLKPFYAPVGHRLLIRSKNGTIMTPQYLSVYDKYEKKLTDVSLLGYNVSLRIYTTSGNVYYAKITGGTAQDIEVYDLDSNASQVINNTLSVVNETERYQIKVNTINNVNLFYIDTGDSITYFSDNGNNMTPSTIIMYDEKFTQLAWYGVSGWGNKRTLTYDKVTPAKYVMLADGTAQAITIVNDTKKATKVIEKCLPSTEYYPFNVRDIDTSTIIDTFESSVSSNSASESFIFFTDPHTLRDRPPAKEETYYMLSLIKKYYDDSSANFVVCGGDWLQQDDTPTLARRKLAYAIGHCDDMLSPCYQMVGNHDTNYQGTESLSQGQLNNIMCNKEVKSYYSFVGHSARFYILDSGLDWQDSVSAYCTEQIAWLCESLRDGSDSYIVIGIHIFWENSSYTLSPMATQLTSIINAYNNRQSYTYDGVTYNFASVTGKIEFVLTGHMHADMSQTLTSGVPVVATTNAGYGTYTFDMINADFTAKTLTFTRVGTGTSRTFVLP